ncbi:prostatic acid phosphatase-like [Oratosquilla oratoria]|uniref:prostatic acid phosphatase-like n=1 Tax=Oratosquilla oratoria TaxID=337810 RepID=UPI003F7685FE
MVVLGNKTNFSVLIFLSILTYRHTIVKAAEPTLEIVHVLFRHGDRAPVESYPNDPYKDGATWPNGFGQLTQNGKRMQYALGNWLRKRYDGFINETWKTEEVYVKSTDYDRTLMSAQSNMAAFYYPNDAMRFNKSIPWVPTPIHTVPLEFDVLLNVQETCPRIEKEKIIQEQLPRVKKVIEENQWLFKYLTEKSGNNITTIEEVDYLYDTLHIEMIYNLTLPDWTTKVLDKMKELSDFSFELVAYTKEMKRLRAGPLIKEIQEHMHQKAGWGHYLNARMYCYTSAHDTTVAQLLQGD